MKKQLGVFDANRLTELVSIHLNPPGEFMIYANGEVSINKAPWLKRLLNIRDDNTMDFLSVAQVIADKLMDSKRTMPLVQALCGEAIGILIETNDRQEVIKKLYTAHLVDADLSNKTLLRNNNNQQNRPPRAEITKVEIIERKQPRAQNIQIYDNRNLTSMMAQNIAEAMNNADVIMIEE
jgi:hypothetical protein